MMWIVSDKKGSSIPVFIVATGVFALGVSIVGRSFTQSLNWVTRLSQKSIVTQELFLAGTKLERFGKGAFRCLKTLNDSGQKALTCQILRNTEGLLSAQWVRFNPTTSGLKVERDKIGDGAFIETEEESRFPWVTSFEICDDADLISTTCLLTGQQLSAFHVRHLTTPGRQGKFFRFRIGAKDPLRKDTWSYYQSAFTTRAFIEGQALKVDW